MYHKVPIISPGLIFVQKSVFLGLFSGELIFGEAYYWKEFCVSKWVGYDNKNSLTHYENSLNSLKQLAPTVQGLCWGGLIIERIFASEIWGGLIFRRALFVCLFVLFCFVLFCFFLGGGGLLSEFYGIYTSIYRSYSLSSTQNVSCDLHKVIVYYPSCKLLCTCTCITFAIPPPPY